MNAEIRMFLGLEISPISYLNVQGLEALTTALPLIALPDTFIW